MADSWIGIGIRNEGAEGERAVRQSLSNIEDSAKRARSATDELTGALRRGLGAVGAALAVREVIRATIEAERSVAKLTAALRATGGASGQTVDGLQDMAAELQRVTTFSDDAVMSAQSLMLTFNKVGGETFPRAIRAAADMASALGQDLSSASFVVGKALQNPAEGLSMLGRQIGGIDDATEKYIKRLVETGQLQKAQAKVLELLESRYKGNAEAMRNTLGGALAGLKNAFGDLLEGKGGSVNDLTKGVNELTKTLSDPDVINAFQRFVGGVLTAVQVLVKAGTTAVEIMRGLGEEAAKLVVMATDPGLAFRMANDRSPGERLDPSRSISTKEGKAAVNKAFASVNPDLAARKFQVKDGKLSEIKAAEEKAGALTGDAAKEAERAADAYAKLWASLDKTRQGMLDWATALEVAHKAGAKPAEIEALGDAYAENLVGGLDEVAVATREYEATMASLNNLMGGFENGKEIPAVLSPERYEELAGRAHDAWAAIAQGAQEAGDVVESSLTTVLQGLEDTLVDLSTNWGKATAQIVNGFGRIVSSQERVAKAQKDVNRLNSDDKASIQKREAATKELTDAMNDQFKMNLSGWATIAEGASAYFDEGSRGYKVLQSASQVFHAAELAMTIAELVPKGISAILNQGNGDPYSAFGRMAVMAAIVAGLGVATGGFSSKGSAMPDPNSGANTGTGTVFGDPGATSKSIANSMEELTEVESAGLEVNRLMLVQLRSIDAAIRGVGNVLVRNAAITGSATGMQFADTYDPRVDSSENDLVNLAQSGINRFMTMGMSDMIIANTKAMDSIFGTDFDGMATEFTADVMNAVMGGLSTAQMDTGLAFNAGQTLGSVIANDIGTQFYATIRETKDAEFGRTVYDRYYDVFKSTDEELRDNLTKVVVNLSDVMKGAAEMLGLDADKARKIIESMTLGFDKISLQGLSADAVQERLSAVFSALGDRMGAELAKALDPEFLKDFQQVGEGAMQTLIRIAVQTNALTRALETMGISLEGVSAMMRVEVTQSLIDLAGGLEGLANNIANYVDNFFSDEEKNAMAGDRLRRQFAALGVAMPGTAAGFRALVEGLDLTTERGREMFTVLTSMSGQAAEYFNVMQAAMEAASEAAVELRRVLDEARYGAMLPEDQLQSLMNQFNAVYQAALTSTGDELIGNASTLTELINPLLDKVSEVYATGSQAQQLRDFVLSAGDIVASLLEGFAAPSAPQEAQVQQLTQANEHLAASVRVQQEGFTQMIERADKMIDRLDAIHNDNRLASIQ